MLLLLVLLLLLLQLAMLLNVVPHRANATLPFLLLALTDRRLPLVRLLMPPTH